eukprot:TRINITY_DN2298_c0_g1_i1.p1 TRINITY_DN2298_c0_g1~~TRINITY_DN2298_c0_g1_i1.p1  ORF type:complete len:226 (+),score=60.59 TRINITY_DN2298_c0_g1_i1:239-916(+)
MDISCHSAPQPLRQLVTVDPIRSETMGIPPHPNKNTTSVTRPLVPSVDFEKYASELTTLSVLELASTFQKEQDKRVQVYRRFEEGFAEFLGGRDNSKYVSGVSVYTAKFAAISKKIRLVEHELSKRATDGSDMELCARLAMLIRTVQEREKHKLEVTIGDQIKKKEFHIDHNGFDDEDGGDPEARAMYHKGRKERVQMMNQIVLDINEALEEWREEVADMNESSD